MFAAYLSVHSNKIARHIGRRIIRGAALAALMVAGTLPIAPARADDTAGGLKPNDVVPVVGDSITEQKMYSVLIEDYLLMCQPADHLRVSQVGWSGEVAPSASNRLEVSMLPFAPTVATVCYGMNDGGYSPLNDEKAERYRTAQTSIVEKFKKAGVHTIVLGCGAVDSNSYRNDPAKAEMYNKTLASLSDIDRQIARQQGVTFADLHGIMVDTMARAKAKYGPGYQVFGNDGVHPNWNGHLVMAYAYLKGLGCDGNIGTITYDAAAGTADTTAGHKVLSSDKSDIKLESSKYPFCFVGDPKLPTATSGITEFMPFNQDLNRFTLVVKNAPAKGIKITWGKTSKTFDADTAGKGINLAAEFTDNPFSDQFAKVQAGIAQQQSFETLATKQYFLSLQSLEQALPGDKDAIGKLRQDLIDKIDQNRDASAAAVTPLTHTIHIGGA
jgi:lysophospholipase L1-like esterase